MFRAGSFRQEFVTERKEHDASQSERSANGRIVEHVERRAAISSRTRDTIMFGEVPICVIGLPTSEANATGIRNIEGGTFEAIAICMATGSYRKRPRVLTKAERMATRGSRCLPAVAGS
jgi:hypothetical protein